ncbi:hypothetical protein [Wolbachia endosymbiont of Litomosoides sigmodontis]|uniref:hypothetical protein n=1 Tax=Wolbachia endosymbiont of Litomosoides sigmodontis TaxID=80850 RepID=UPI0026731D3C|nr:hypothetical protein [Wolbachia endosymbiont of Litomosoides sigmodontis]
MILPIGAEAFSETIRTPAEVYNLRDSLRKKGYSTSIGDEGGFHLTLKVPRKHLT